MSAIEITPSELDGPPMDGALLLFETTGSYAAKNEAKAWRAFSARALPAISFGEKPAPNPKPTAREALGLQQLIGNVIVLWDFPRKHRSRSSAIVRSCLATAERRASEGPERTKIDTVSPFHFDGRLMPRPRVAPIPGSCRPGSPILIVDAYTCRSTASSQPGCEKGCTFQSCWRDSGDARTLTCLLTPFVEPQLGASISTDEVRIRVTTQLAPAKPAANPLAGQPWGFELANGDFCAAAFSDVSVATAHQALDYTCGGTAGPIGRVRRTHAQWTVEMSTDGATSTARITEARFAANEP